MGKLDSEYNAIRDRIFDLMKARGMSQKDFARAINVSPQTITDWKNGKSHSFAGMMSVIPPALETTAGWLLAGKGEVFFSKEQYNAALREEELRVMDMWRQSAKNAQQTNEELVKALEHAIELAEKSNKLLSNNKSKHFLELFLSLDSQDQDEIIAEMLKRKGKVPESSMGGR